MFDCRYFNADAVVSFTASSVSSPVFSSTFMQMLDQSMKAGKTNPSGPFLFLATKTRPLFACLSCIVRDSEKIKSATKHLLKASEIASIVITSAFRPDRLVCEAVQTGQL